MLLRGYFDLRNMKGFLFEDTSLMYLEKKEGFSSRENNELRIHEDNWSKSVYIYCFERLI